MPVDYAKDAKFFEFVHQLARRSGDQECRSSERRYRERRPYPYDQYVAPFRAGRMPEAEDFERVRCHDLSTCGFSFLTSRLPNHDLIVAAFGTPPGFTYLTAQIRYAKRVSHTGCSMFQVGCQFLGRIDSDDAARK